jgi:hypothetical protein
LSDPEPWPLEEPPPTRPPTRPPTPATVSPSAPATAGTIPTSAASGAGRAILHWHRHRHDLFRRVRARGVLLHLLAFSSLNSRCWSPSVIE